MNGSYASQNITHETALVMYMRAQRLTESLASAQMRYIDTFGDAAMVDASQRASGALLSVAPKTDLTVWWQSMGRSYLLSLIFFLLYFCLRVRNREFVFLFEIPRILAASVCWPVALFTYPNVIDPRVQLKQSLELACWILTVAASFLGIGGSAAYGQNIYRGIKQKTSPTRPSTTADTPTNSTAPQKKNGAPPSFSFAGDATVFPFNQIPDSPLPYTQIGYSWSGRIGILGSVVGGGLIEYGDSITPFSLNFVGYKPPTTSRISWIIPGAEVGISKTDGPFAQIGGKISLSSIPRIGNYIRRATSSATVGGFVLLAGNRVPYELLIGVETRKLPMDRFSLHGNFIFRIRPGETNNVSFTEAVLFHQKVPVSLVGQYRLIGPNGRLSFGLRFSHAF
jgi:hypothetical protein